MNHHLLNFRKRLYGRAQLAVAIALVVGAFFGLVSGHEVGKWVPKLSGGVLAVCVWWGLFCFFVAEIHGFEQTKTVHPAVDWSAKEVQVFSGWVVLVGSPLIAIAQVLPLAMGVAGFGTGLFFIAWILRMGLAWVTAHQGSWFGYVSGTLGLPVSIGLFSLAYFRVTESLACGCGDPLIQWSVDSLGFLSPTHPGLRPAHLPLPHPPHVGFRLVLRPRNPRLPPHRHRRPRLRYAESPPLTMRKLVHSL